MIPCRVLKFELQHLVRKNCVHYRSVHNYEVEWRKIGDMVSGRGEVFKIKIITVTIVVLPRLLQCPDWASLERITAPTGKLLIINPRIFTETYPTFLMPVTKPRLTDKIFLFPPVPHIAMLADLTACYSCRNFYSFTPSHSQASSSDH